jgi:simple sugar transport system permease protein
LAEELDPVSGPAGIDRLLHRLRERAPRDIFGLGGLLIALLVFFSILLPASFPTIATVQSIMFQLPELGLLAFAMVIPLISGGLNLAIIATANQCALLMAWIMTSLIAPETSAGGSALIIALALAAGLAYSGLVGLVTGILVATLGVHPILVTLGTMSLIDGVSIYLTRGTILSGFPDSFQWIGNGTVMHVPVPFLILLATAGVLGLVLSRTQFGISVYMIGSNLQATRYSGIDTRRVIVGVYTLSSALCFVAATLMMARFNSASAEYAQSYLLITILSAVLGGVDPFGGFGRIAGLLISMVILQVISSGLNLLGVNQHLTLAIWGFTLIAVMAMRFYVAPLIADTWRFARPKRGASERDRPSAAKARQP